MSIRSGSSLCSCSPAGRPARLPLPLLCAPPALCSLLAYGARFEAPPSLVARRQLLAPHSRRPRAPPALRALLACRARFEAPPSLVARRKLLAPQSRRRRAPPVRCDRGPARPAEHTVIGSRVLLDSVESLFDSVSVGADVTEVTQLSLRHAPAPGGSLRDGSMRYGDGDALPGEGVLPVLPALRELFPGGGPPPGSGGAGGGRGAARLGPRAGAAPGRAAWAGARGGGGGGRRGPGPGPDAAGRGAGEEVAAGGGLAARRLRAGAAAAAGPALRPGPAAARGHRAPLRGRPRGRGGVGWRADQAARRPPGVDGNRGRSRTAAGPTGSGGGGRQGRGGAVTGPVAVAARPRRVGDPRGRSQRPPQRAVLERTDEHRMTTGGVPRRVLVVWCPDWPEPGPV